MTISDKTRKQLWAKSGNRCAICKEELFQKPGIEDGKLNVGEECHIISGKKGGPRHIAGLSEYDIYDNLLLLCRNHHKEIDTLTETYPEELLRFMKTNHENWVSESLQSRIDNSKIENARFIKRIVSGKELFEIIDSVHGYRADYDDQEDTDENQFVGSILQAFTDYGDLLGMVSAEPAERIQISSELRSLLIEMEERGYFLFAERNTERVMDEANVQDEWEIATLIIKKMDNEKILQH